MCVAFEGGRWLEEGREETCYLADSGESGFRGSFSLRHSESGFRVAPSSPGCETRIPLSTKVPLNTSLEKTQQLSFGR